MEFIGHSRWNPQIAIYMQTLLFIHTIHTHIHTNTHTHTHTHTHPLVDKFLQSLAPLFDEFFVEKSLIGYVGGRGSKIIRETNP